MGQVLPIAGTPARWASLRIGEGACEKDALPDHAWEDGWTRLGDAPPDVCQLAKPDSGAEPPARLTSIVRLVRDAVRHCPIPQGTSEPKKRIALLDCHRRTSAKFPLSADAVNAEISRALSAQR